MPFQLLSAADVREVSNAWYDRRKAVFEKKVVDEWVSGMMDRLIEKDLKKQLLDVISYAKTPDELWVSAGYCYDQNYRFWIGPQSMTIKQLIYRTDALQRLAKEIGSQIKVRPLYDDGMIFFKIEFWPTV